MPRNTSLLLSGVVFWFASSFIYAFPLATLGVHTKSGCFPLGRLFFWILLQTSLTSNTLAVSALPHCYQHDTWTWEAITCTSVTISELDDGYLISRGMDGYSANEYVTIELDSGPGTLSFTDFNTEEWSDFVYIDIYAVDHTLVEWFSFAGASKPPDIDIFGYARIFWNTLSSKGAGFGWVFTFTSNPNITSTTATTMTTTITTMTITTMTITTTTTLLHFSFDVSSTSCKVDVEEECIQNPDFPSMTNASQILCTGQTNLALYSTAFQTDGDASLTMYDMYNSWGDDNAKLWFSDFPGR